MFFDILAAVSISTFDEIYWEIVQRLYFQIIMEEVGWIKFCPTVLIKTLMDYFYLIELYYAVVFNDTIEDCKRCIDLMKNKECINSAMKLLNKYKRTDLIAILLDRNRNSKSFGDFEL